MLQKYIILYTESSQLAYEAHLQILHLGLPSAIRRSIWTASTVLSVKFPSPAHDAINVNQLLFQTRCRGLKSEPAQGKEAAADQNFEG